MTNKRRRDPATLAAWAEQNADEPADPTLTRLERELDRARRERDSARAAHRAAEREVESLQDDVAVLSALNGVSVERVPWKAPRSKQARKRAATALVMLSDLHFDEIVKPEEVMVAGNPLNAYDRRIAEQRLQRTAEGAVRLGTELMPGFTYEGVIILLAGDLVSGMLHDLPLYNETPSVIATVDYWADHLATFLDTVATAYGDVPCHVVSVVGNHGRNTVKPKTAGRVEDSFDHHLARLLQRHYRHDTRFTWNIPMSADAYVDVYNERLLVTHGDQARGGSGISGLMTPLALLDHRKRRRDAGAGSSHTHMFLGHWHQYLRLGNITVNGAMVGTGPYSYLGNFGHEAPSQSFAVITPEHGVTIEAAIYCADRKAEGW